MAIVLAGIFWSVFLFFQAQGIYGGDSGDLVTAAAIGGVAHPPGYPLYTLLGWITNKLPFFTVSWRVGLWSSLPHAVVLALVYLLVVRFTKHWVYGVFAAIILAGNYVFFLYSVTPEVFALFDLFFLGIWMLLLRFRETGKSGYLIAAAWVFGLSLSHHHLILFGVPGYAYYLYRIWGTMGAKTARISRVAVFSVTGIVAGLLPYLYVPLAASRYPIIDWDHAVDWGGFVRLITRRDYGTFLSNVTYGESIRERVVALMAYADFIRVDLTIIGIAFVVLGMAFLLRKQRDFGSALLVQALMFGPFFFFYASFPLVNRFTLATYERFLLPTYIIYSLLIGVGVYVLIQWIRISVSRLMPRKRLGVAIVALTAVLFLYPLMNLGVRLTMFAGLSADRTADMLARDILDSVPDRAVVLLSQDTTLFTTQYLRYATGYRQDVAVLHAVMLSQGEYRNGLRRRFPELYVPAGDGPDLLADFVTSNATLSSVFSNRPIAVGSGWHWVPNGLLLKATPTALLPSVDDMYAENSGLWAAYQDPNTGILRRYHHMMLSDVLNVYTASRVTLGKTLMNAGRYPEAVKELSAAVSYGGDTSRIDALKERGFARFHLKDCLGAIADFDLAIEDSPSPPNEFNLYKSVTYRECAGDAERADEWYGVYERGKTQSDQSLETL